MYAGGILIPFGQSDIEDPWVILNCIPELSVIYETKVRAPFKVVFEVCKLSEIHVLIEESSDSSQQNKLKTLVTESVIETDLTQWWMDTSNLVSTGELQHPDVWTDPFKTRWRETKDV